MARLPRLSLAGHPHHVLQRGHDRQPVFRDRDDHERFLELLGDALVATSMSLHAYVLMPNHVHLLLTPGQDAALSRLMQALGRRYVQFFNRRHQRSGTLWEGRYRAAPIQSERHLLACMAYLDLNPVRAGLVARPADYPWSSHAHYVGLRSSRLLTPHPLVWALGNTPFEREARYAERVALGLAAQEEAQLVRSVLGGWPLGDARFVAGLQEHTPRRLEPRPPGRPRRE